MQESGKSGEQRRARSASITEEKSAEAPGTRGSFFARSGEDKRRRALKRWTVENETFELDSRYQITDFMGQGAYGVVIAATDLKDGSRVAIKKVKQVFHTKTLAKRTLRELRILRHLRHDNIISVNTILRPVNTELFQELYVVMELMETDLAVIIKSPQHLRDEHIQFFLYQIVRALKYLHSANIVHRDLKPRNLLVNTNCDLKIADFGLARVYNNKQTEGKIVPMTEYVTTRWYRAPEIIVSWHRYTSAVDMWATGCILAELLARWPTFPGRDSVNQLELIAERLGKPPESFISKARKPMYRTRLRELPDSEGDLLSHFEHANPLAVDLLSKMLRYNPDERISAAEAMQHPYLATLHEPAFEPDGPEIPEVEFQFETARPNIDELREELLNEVRHYHSYMRFTHNMMTMMRPKSRSKGRPEAAADPKRDRVTQVKMENGAAAAPQEGKGSNGSVAATTAGAATTRTRASAQRNAVAARAIDRSSRTAWTVPDPNPHSDDSPDPR